MIIFNSKIPCFKYELFDLDLTIIDVLTTDREKEWNLWLQKTQIQTLIVNIYDISA
jgi:hypothetical protein